jgi:hypothetical protein
MGNFSDLSRLSFTLEIMGLVLAWGETRRPFWFVRFEQALDAVSEASFGDVVSLLPALLEYVVVVFLIGAYLVFGQSFESEQFKYLYGGALLLVLFSPFFIKKMKVFSRGNAITTLGLIVAAVGVLIQIAQ